MKSFPRSNKKISALQVRAFTLVEVVLALAIASFGLISMAGLLTAGLKTFHDAINATTDAQITQQLANQLQLASYSDLTNSSSSIYYFTQEAIATNAANAVYSATVSAPVELTVPGGDVTSPPNTLAFTISIWSKSSPMTTNVTPIYIANNGS